MDLPVSDHLDLELAEGWLTVWFNEPERRNPLTGARVAALIALCGALEGRRDIRGVTLRGQGGMFCAGGDLKGFQAAFSGAAAQADILAMSREGAQVFDAIDRLPQFTVAVVEGAAMAGGFGMACCADYVIADETAKFALTETKIGVIPAQIAPIVIRRLGARAARKHLLMAATLVGAEAVQAGVADIAVPADGIDGEVAAIRATIRKTGPNALAVTKALVQDVMALPRAEQIDRAARDFTAALTSDEGKEGVMSFLQKRKPNWAE